MVPGRQLVKKKAHDTSEKIGGDWRIGCPIVNVRAPRLSGRNRCGAVIGLFPSYFRFGSTAVGRDGRALKIHSGAFSPH